MSTGGITIVFVSEATVSKGDAQLLAPWNTTYSLFVLLGTSGAANVTLIMIQGGELFVSVSQLKTSGIDTMNTPIRIIRKNFFFTVMHLWELT